MAKKNDIDKKLKLMGDMPHSIEAEQALLGCLLMDTKIQVEISAYLTEEDFYAESHKNIFSAMLDIIKLYCDLSGRIFMSKESNKKVTAIVGPAIDFFAKHEP